MLWYPPPPPPMRGPLNRAERRSERRQIRRWGRHQRLHRMQRARHEHFWRRLARIVAAAAGSAPWQTPDV